eukprot:440688-Rhodomonas_salina.1
MVLRDVRYWHSVWCYAMYGTEIVYGATRCDVLAQRMVLCDVRYWHSVWCYAISGTDIASGAARAIKLDGACVGRGGG